MTDHVDKYVDLRINGKLFPSWVAANFKKYQLPEIMRKSDSDPCDIDIKKELRRYQKFLGNYLSYNSPYKNILIYHGLGAGKTVSAINIYNTLYNASPDWNVFLLIKASLQAAPWMKDLKVWLEEDNYESRMRNIMFVHYDSPTADKNFKETIRKSDPTKKNLFIIDEVHNFINNKYSNINSRIACIVIHKSKNCQNNSFTYT